MLVRLVTRRALETVPMLVASSVVVFCLLAAAPIDPARRALAVAGAGDAVDERDVAAKRVELGLDQPIWERYARWVADAAHLDLGESFVSKKPLASLIGERLWPSTVLAVTSLALAVAIGVPLGVVAATRAGSPLDHTIRLLTLLGASLPGFWLALFAMWLFSVQLGWLPALGSFTPLGIIMPAAVLAVRNLGLLTRLTRALTLEELRSDYVRTARSRGVAERAIVARHALPNALMPVITVIGLDFASLIAHASVIEWVFAWPGIGKLGVDAALAGDVPVILGFVLVVSLVVVASTFVVDVAYGVVDPRQRQSA